MNGAREWITFACTTFALTFAVGCWNSVTPPAQTDATGCPQGTLDCPCAVNESCTNNLICVEGTCVAPEAPKDGGQPGSDASDPDDPDTISAEDGGQSLVDGGESDGEGDAEATTDEDSGEWDDSGDTGDAGENDQTDGGDDCDAPPCLSPACTLESDSHVGCRFYAVDLDNFATNCSTDTDCGSCNENAGGVSGPDICRNPSGETCDGDSDCDDGFTCLDGNCHQECSNDAECGNCNASGVCSFNNIDAEPLGLTVANDADESLEIDVFRGSKNGGPTHEATLKEGALETFELPALDIDDTALSEEVYRVETDGPVSAYQFSPSVPSDAASQDSSLLLPARSVGSDYRVVGWRVPAEISPSDPQEMTAVLSIAAVERTSERPTTEVTVADNPVKIVGGSNIDEIPADGERTFELERGEVLQLASEMEAGNDLTGTTIETRGNRIAVFSGTEASQVPASTQYSDHLEEQLLPTTQWGNEHVVSKFEPRGDEDDLVRVVADENETKVVTRPKIDGVNGEVIGPDEEKQMVTFRTDESVFVEGVDANPPDDQTDDPPPKPIAVGQFMVGSTYAGPNGTCTRFDDSGCKVTRECENQEGRIGDPAFSLNVPASQFRQDYVVTTPEAYLDDYISVVAPEGASVEVDGSTLDNAAESVTTPGGQTWQVFRTDVDPGAHRVTADQPVGLYSYGYDCDVSYAHPGGRNATADPLSQ